MRKLLTAVPLLLLATLAACGDGGADGPSVASVGNTASASASPDPSAPAEDEEERNRQFTQCMRDEGIDIDDAKGGPGERQGVAARGDKQKIRQAMEKCRRYLPNGGEPPRPSAADLEKFREYAVCMRENGLPDFPDPDPATGQFSGDSLREAGISKDKIVEVDEKCRDKLPVGPKKGGGK